MNEMYIDSTGRDLAPSIISGLRKDNAALMAHVERLRGALENTLCYIPLDVRSHTTWEDDDGTIVEQAWYVRAKEALASTPEQSLEALRAEAGRAVQELREFAKHLREHGDFAFDRVRGQALDDAGNLCDGWADEIEREGPKE